MKSFRQLLDAMIPDQMELFEMTAVPARLDVGKRKRETWAANKSVKHGWEI